MKDRMDRLCAPAAVVESLESRAMLSAAPRALLPDAVPVRTHTVLKVSRHTATFGQDEVFTAAVSAPAKLGALAGVVEFLSNGTAISGTSGVLSVSLDGRHRATYTFSSGNIALFVGKQKCSAQFISSNTLPGSTSKATLVNIRVPHLKTASDGLETATVKAGHGPQIKAGQTADVVYTGFLARTGTIFDYATADHGAGAAPTLSFAVEAAPEQVIPGFDQGTIGMRKGETRVLAIPATLAYGAAGAGATIPPNADLVFLVMLLSVS